MVRLTIVTKVKTGKRIEFLQFMEHVKIDEESRPGGGRAFMWQDVRQPALHTLLFEWETDQDFERYLETEGMVFLLGGLIVLCDNAEFSITPRSEKHNHIKTVHFNSTLRNHRQRKSIG